MKVLTEICGCTLQTFAMRFSFKAFSFVEQHQVKISECFVKLFNKVLLRVLE